MSEDGVPSYTPVIYEDWRGPQRAARLYYRHQLDEVPGGDDASSSYVIVAYQESWALSPALAALNWHRSEDGISITPETPVDDSRIFGRYRPSRFKISRHLFCQNTAQDETTEFIHAPDVPFMPIAYEDWRGPQRAAAQYYRGVMEATVPVVDEECAPRGRGPGVPTTAGLARYVDGENCDPRDGAGAETCDTR